MATKKTDGRASIEEWLAKDVIPLVKASLAKAARRGGVKLNNPAGVVCYLKADGDYCRPSTPPGPPGPPPFELTITIRGK